MSGTLHKLRKMSQNALNKKDYFYLYTRLKRVQHNLKVIGNRGLKVREGSKKHADLLKQVTNMREQLERTENALKFNVQHSRMKSLRKRIRRLKDPTKKR